MLRYCARGAGVSVGVSGEMDALKLPLSARGRGCVLAIATCARPSTTGSLSTVTLLLTASRRKMSPHKASDPPCHTMANHGCEPPLQAAQRVVLSCHRRRYGCRKDRIAMQPLARPQARSAQFPNERELPSGFRLWARARLWGACVNRPHTGVTGSSGRACTAGSDVTTVSSKQLPSSVVGIKKS